MGRADAQVCGGTGAHVVAEHARPGLPLPVSSIFTPTSAIFASVCWCRPYIGFLNFSATAFLSLVGFWLTFVVGFSEAGETNAFFGILKLLYSSSPRWLVVWFLSPTAAAAAARMAARARQ
jgi:hypothetical protein